MPTPKGYSSQKKRDSQEAQFVTVSPTATDKHALDVRDIGPVYVVDSDLAEAGGALDLVVATAHVARPGDRIRFTSGPLLAYEADVVSATANEITLGQDLPVASAPGDQFDVLRSISITLSQAGEILTTQGPVTFNRDGIETQVNEDTVTPANNAPLPVKLTDLTGDVTVTANQLLVQLSHTGANPDSTQIGDGTEIAQVNATGELQVSDDDARTFLGSIDADIDVQLSTRATEATLATLDGKVTVCDTSNVSVTSSALPTGAATEATLASADTAVNSIDTKTPVLGANVTAASTPVNIASDQTVPVSQVSQPLPTGAATEATLLAADGRLTTIDTSLNNIEISQDVQRSTRASEATLATLDGKVTVCDTSNVTIGASALPLGAATEATVLATSTEILALDKGAGAVSASTRRVHLSDESLAALETITVDTYDVLDATYLDASVSNIPGSASSPLEILASTGGEVRRIQFADTVGVFYELLVGPAAGEVRRLVIGPGSDQTIEVSIPAASRISVRRLDSTSPADVGSLAVNFIG